MYSRNTVFLYERTHTFLRLACLFASILFLTGYHPHRAHAQSNCLPGPSGCPTIGSICPDGTVYIGCAPTLYQRLYAARCDGGQTWNGSICTGTRTAQYWANSSASTVLRTTGVVSLTDGKANTDALTNGVVDGTGDSRTTAALQPHNAAQYCADLVLHGYDDWYLPAYAELEVLYVFKNSDALDATFGTGLYWSSTEYGQTEAARIDFNSATRTPANYNKYATSNIRCIRRN